MRSKRTGCVSACAACFTALILCLTVETRLSGGVFHEKPDDGFRKPDVVWVPTPNKVVYKMLEMAEVKKGDILYDLGCGDGRIVVAAAKKYGIRAKGFEIDPYLVGEAEDYVKAEGAGELAEIKRADIFELDLTGASIITLYLLPELNVKLIPQLSKCSPGTRILSHDFDIAGVVPEKTVMYGGSVIYLWITPLKFKK